MSLWPLSTLHNCDAFIPVCWLDHNTINSDDAMQFSYVWTRIWSSVCVVSPPCCSFKCVDGRMRGLLTSIRTSVAICHVTRTPDPGPSTAEVSWDIKCCCSIVDISSVDQCRPLQHRPAHPPWIEIIYCYCNMEHAVLCSKTEFECCSSCHTMHVV